MFSSKNKVRMHDIDMAGILYFSRQFRFVHEALEDFMENEGYPFKTIFHDNKFLFVIVHCEADYLAPLKIGDAIEIHLTTKKIGATSFSLFYDIFDESKKRVGTAETVHVVLDRGSRKKIPIPDQLRKMLQKHQQSPH
ncbi:MAG: thioesterase family protein [Waddliaceae bacterium]